MYIRCFHAATFKDSWNKLHISLWELKERIDELKLQDILPLRSAPNYKMKSHSTAAEFSISRNSPMTDRGKRVAYNRMGLTSTL